MAGKNLALPTDLQEELCCSLCQDLYSTPKVLPCLHTFCQDCLELRAETTFSCPACGAKTVLSHDVVQALPENQAVLNLCDRIHNQAVMPSLEPGSSDEEQEGSLKEFHPGSHCQTHSDEKLGLYCVQCKVAVCTVCLDETHAGHRMMTLKKALEDRRSAVAAFATQAKDLEKNYCSFIRGLRDTEKSLHEQKQQADSSIIQAYEQMVQKLTETKRGMLKEVEEKHHQNVEAIRQTKDPLLMEIYELSSTCAEVNRDVAQHRAEFTEQEKRLFQVVGSVTERVACAPATMPTPPLTPLTPQMPEQWEMEQDD